MKRDTREGVPFYSEKGRIKSGAAEPRSRCLENTAPRYGVLWHAMYFMRRVVEDADPYARQRHGGMGS